jgi:S-adenosylmethionine-diacylgycerolhomoserine-N-methlytransferase
MKTNVTDPFRKMDSMYRYQRYFYDLTRKYYLIGRDQLLDSVAVSTGQNVLEIGTGTGRNLAVLASRYPNANFYGLDASQEMLVTAEKKVARHDLRNVKLAVALAQDFSYSSTFGLEKKFDSIFFSYSISMIPVWREALDRAFENLSPGGSIYIVDFCDQTELPGWFRELLRRWLTSFGVTFWDELFPYLAMLSSTRNADLQILPIARRYAFIAHLKTKS